MTTHIATQASDQPVVNETIRCPKCDERLVFDPKLSGISISCPKCWHYFQMPVTELALMLQIRDFSKATRFWTRLIFFLLAFPYLILILASLNR